MMTLPGNRTRNPGIQASTVERSPQPDHVLPRCSAISPCPEAGASGELTSRVYRNTHYSVWCCLRSPRRGLWPFAQRNRKVARELHPGPGPLSHPTRVTLSPFPVCVNGVFLGYLCLKQVPADLAQKSVAGCVHTPGQSRLGGIGRVQEAPAAQEDPTPSGASPLSRVSA